MHPPVGPRPGRIEDRVKEAEPVIRRVRMIAPRPFLEYRAKRDHALTGIGVITDLGPNWIPGERFFACDGGPTTP
ncbi:MAG: hypothetical protein HKN13_02260 [Rhodothermales bacterium]|nr:hypothetical protein [Rhodothermales bacterium]